MGIALAPAEGERVGVRGAVVVQTRCARTLLAGATRRFSWLTGNSVVVPATNPVTYPEPPPRRFPSPLWDGFKGVLGKLKGDDYYSWLMTIKNH